MTTTPKQPERRPAAVTRRYRCGRLFQQFEAGAIAIVDAWNSAMPSGYRVRILTQARFDDLCYTLRSDYTVDEISQAIRFYGRQTWQRRHGFKRFDKFIAESGVLVEWIERAQADAEQRASRQRPASQGEAALQQAARRICQHDQRRQFDALGRDTRLRYCRMADKQLGQNAPPEARMLRAIKLWVTDRANKLNT